MDRKAKYPAPHELVVCKITKVLNYGVFVELLEYDNIKGFVHISQVASSWIKNIRNFVKENQMRVARVSYVNPQKNQVDLSLNKVSAGEQRSRLEQYRQLKKPQRFVEIIAKKTKSDYNQAWQEISGPLLEEHDSLYDAFQAYLMDGSQVLSKVPEKYRKHLAELIDKNMEIPKKVVKGILTLYSTAPDGVEVVRTALVDAESLAKDAEVEIIYAGSGKYQVKATSFDYKVSERVLRGVVEAAIGSAKKSSGFGQFEKTV